MTNEYWQGRSSGNKKATTIEPKSTALLYQAIPATASVHIPANNDAQAVGQWLNEYTASAQTFRAYRKEAERLLLWLEAQQLTLADVDRQRLDAFEHFLADPQPIERWIGPPRPHASSQWRPFRRPLNAASRRQSLVILQGLFSWLVEAGWVAHNPFRLMRDKRRRLDNRQEDIERYLERPLWDWLWQWLNRPLEEGASSRTRFVWQRRRLIFGFAYLLAPRISEMAAARMGDFVCREGHWWWRVVGKGDKLASIPVPTDMLVLLEEWRKHLGLKALPEPYETGPVLRGLNGQRGLGDNQLYRLIKTSFEEAAREIEVDQDGAVFARTLRKATPHWLRHTAITHQAQSGIELRYLAKTARHSRLDTTARYLHAEANEWQRQLAAHQLEK
nr:site-specific integrase [uncultured Halomonas sp.]